MSSVFKIPASERGTGTEKVERARELADCYRNEEARPEGDPHIWAFPPSHVVDEQGVHDSGGEEGSGDDQVHLPARAVADDQLEGEKRSSNECFQEERQGELKMWGDKLKGERRKLERVFRTRNARGKLEMWGDRLEGDKKKSEWSFWKGDARGSWKYWMINCKRKERSLNGCLDKICQGELVLLDD